MAQTDREAYEYFKNDLNAPREAASLAYAAFAFDKYEWVKKFTEKTGFEPTYEEVDRWISELPNSRFEELKRNALTVFKAAVDTYSESAISAAYEAGKRDALVNQMRSATSFWRNLPGNMAVGIASSFAFGLLLILASLLFNKDPSPVALYQKLANPPAQPIKQ